MTQSERDAIEKIAEAVGALAEVASVGRRALAEAHLEEARRLLREEAQ